MNNNEDNPIIEKHNGINVLRDDLLVGGTKSILMSSIIKPDIDEYVYASPVYGGFQIALSAYCQLKNKKATIFCAKRNIKHKNTLKCLSYGATVIEVSYGYLSVVEKKAREYCNNKSNIEKIIFGANTIENKMLISDRVKTVITQLGKEPDEIWCAIGSGTLISGILMTVNENVKVFGVQVGAEFIPDKEYKNLTIIKYPKAFDYESRLKVDFHSTANYDLKAFELCLKHQDKERKENKENNTKDKNVLFWNVL